MLANILIITTVTLFLLPGRTDGSGDVPRGIVVDTLACLEHPEQTYSLYLPVSAGDSHPLLVFLEPGARGKLPVGLYKGLAEHYGFILACSNNGRNGPIHLYRDALDATIPDVIRRFNPDTSRLVVCGFSGGGRYAPVYSRERLGAAVIACGAGASPLGGPEQLDLPFYTGIYGRMDMNYLEATETVRIARERGTPAWMVIFEGRHDWPDSVAMDRALGQVLVHWHNTGKMKLDSLELERIRSDMYAYLDSMLSQQRLREAEMTRDLLVQHPLFDASDPEWLDLVSRFPGGRERKKYERVAKKIRLSERRFQDSIALALKGIDRAMYMQMDMLKPPAWWEKQGRKVKKEMKSKEMLSRESAMRKYDYTRRNCLDWANIHMEELQEPWQAARYLEAWCSFEPDEWIGFYWLAVARARTGQDREALRALEKAVENGLPDKAYLEEEESFETLRSLEEYSEIIRNMN